MAGPIKISIITPSFNHDQFIEKCLNSVKSQIGNFVVEHIILDNCSDDKTQSILQQYIGNPGDIKVKVLIEPDNGQTHAINKGFTLSSGEIICWLNTDEYYIDGCLKIVSDCFSKHPEVDVLFGDFDLVDKNGVLLKQRREYFFSKSMLLYYGCFVPSCATFIRRKVIDAGLLLDSKFRVTMDYDWYMRIAKNNFRFAHLNRRLAFFTCHTSNISTTQAVRRRLERRLVQDQYSNIKLGIFRNVYFNFMRYLWISVRLLRRAIRS